MASAGDTKELILSIRLFGDTTSSTQDKRPRVDSSSESDD